MSNDRLNRKRDEEKGTLGVQAALYCDNSCSKYNVDKPKDCLACWDVKVEDPFKSRAQSQSINIKD